MTVTKVDRDSSLERPLELEVGDKVRHRWYAERTIGIVAAVSGEGVSASVEIDFPETGERYGISVRSKHLTKLRDDAGAPEDGGEIGEQHRSQARIAYRLAARYKDRLMHVHGLGWYVWDGRRWAEDERQEATQAVLATVRRAYAQSVGDPTLRKDAEKCETAAGAEGVLKLAATHPDIAVTAAELDADPYLLACANGTLDLRTLELRRHDPADRITKITRGAYDPDAAGETWQSFLKRVLPDEDVRGFLQRVVGVGLLGRVVEHILPIATGKGANGKGTFYKAVGWALGSYAGTAEPELFMHREGAHPTGEMDLRGLRWVVVSESDRDRRLAEATMKRLTGGDTIKARKMRKDFVQFEPSHTPMLVTNHLPRVSGDDPAIWRRLRVVPFTVVIPDAEQDGHLDEALQLEADAILAWAVAGYADYDELGLDEPDAVRIATDAYQLASDAIGRFIEERCLLNPHMHATTGELFDAWCKWAAADGAEPMSSKAFGKAIDDRGYPAVKSTGGRRVRRGIGLYEEDDDVPEEPSWTLV